MSHDPVEAALLAALEKREEFEVRLALAKHRLASNRHQDALTSFEQALVQRPTSPEALRGAAAAASELGLDDRARAYELALSVGAEPDASGDEDETGGESAVELSDATAGNDPPAGHIRLAAVDGEIVEDFHESGVTFADVGGLDALKRHLERNFVAPFRKPELFRRFGRTMRGGLLLYGAPGCGKTYLARALAGELGARFMNVGLPDVLDMWFGESEKRIHELFENARRFAPTVLFFDEIDAIGQRRTSLKGTAGRNLVSQLLAELDGFDGKNDGVFMLGATNHPWDVDPALRRPGRFDRMIFVPPPGPEARRRILEIKLEGRPVAPALVLDGLIHRTEGCSGADLQALIEEATDLAIEATEAAGADLPITTAHLEEAADAVRPSIRAWLDTARNYAVYANDSGAFDDLLEYLRKVRLA